LSPAARAALAIVLVASAGPAGFLLYRAVLGHRLSPAPLASTAPNPQPAGAGPTVSAEPALPTQLPELAMPDRQGQTRHLSDWRGRPLVVNFWATWCEPCRREIPLLETLRRRRDAAGLQVVGIAVDERAAVLKYADAMKIDYPLLIGQEQGLAALEKFGMQPAFPFSVFADRAGRIVAVKIGELHRDDADLILSRLSAVDRGTLSVAAARQQVSDGLRQLAAERARRESTAGGAARSPS